MKYLLGLLIMFCLATPAHGAPKKKAAPKAKAKVAAISKKKAPARAPASKKAKSAPAKKNSPKALAKKPATKSKLAAKAVKGKAPAKSQAQNRNPTPVPESAPQSNQLRTERLPTGMAGLGLGSTAGSMNSNKSFEIRGQARTLSMMLILRNGKENVNFVKVRQDYATEIAKTEF